MIISAEFGIPGLLIIKSEDRILSMECLFSSYSIELS